jgi:hypothetical protein
MIHIKWFGYILKLQGIVNLKKKAMVAALL